MQRRACELRGSGGAHVALHAQRRSAAFSSCSFLLSFTAGCQQAGWCTAKGARLGASAARALVPAPSTSLHSHEGAAVTCMCACRPTHLQCPTLQLRRPCAEEPAGTSAGPAPKGFPDLAAAAAEAGPPGGPPSPGPGRGPLSQHVHCRSYIRSPNILLGRQRRRAWSLLLWQALTRAAARVCRPFVVFIGGGERGRAGGLPSLAAAAAAAAAAAVEPG